MATVAIVGGGFSGTLTALNILRFACRDAPRVILFERRAEAGPGLAYSTRSLVHQLNVPAGNMSAWEDDPDHFYNWLQMRMPTAGSGSFVPRAWYGEYLRDQLALAVRNAGARFEIAHASVSAARIAPDGKVDLHDHAGRVTRADRVVLAIGNFPPAHVPGMDPAVTNHPRYIADPWNAEALRTIQPADEILFVGTGLTMMDLVSTLHAREHAGRMHAISRHGLLPRAHRSPARPPAKRPAPEAIKTWDGTLRSLVRIVRQEVGAQAIRGCDWREVITSLRPITAQLWQKLGPVEQQRFIDRTRSYWDVLRHRAPPETAATIQDLIAAKQLVVRAGRIRSIAPATDGRIEASFIPRRSANTVKLGVHWVINCLGPDSDLTRVPDPLVQQLLADGLTRPDPLGLGFDLAEDGHCLDARGRTVEQLLVVGPMRRARNWEDTAVPELRRQTAQAARKLVRELCADAAAAWPAL